MNDYINAIEDLLLRSFKKENGTQCAKGHIGRHGVANIVYTDSKPLLIDSSGQNTSRIY